MHPTSRRFAANARAAMADPVLQDALARLKAGFRVKRAAAVARLPEFEALKAEARALKDHTLAHLDHYLEAFEAKVVETGGTVHWCRDGAEAKAAVLAICRAAGARTATKGKSMVAEEIGLNDFLEKNGVIPVETDLGEYIIQLRREPPSHIVAPAIHLNRGQVADAFRTAHGGRPPDRDLEEPRVLLDEAREEMRARFLAADVGITGANLLIAETGSTVIVTNEGNGDLTQTLPRVHIVLATIDKVVPTLDDAATILRLLARSATGQELSVYTTFSTGPRRPDDLDGPEQFHVVLLDNGRSAMLGGQFRDMLRCIRCGACINHCPVYGAVGGHAYGWVYPGPMGSVLSPALVGLEQTAKLPDASTLCGRCEEVCPMSIPLPALLRHWREHAFERHLKPARERLGLALWSFAASRPWLYRAVTRLASWGLRRLARGTGRLARVPLAGGWTAARDLPAPSGPGFLDQWRQGKRR
ncbi:LutB/LldF family L-lactate oxidation iron-sulfur protein [Magnetospirillum sp. UT-4]|uniref:LutB/LldF family L-lactate oxidation iron-sulfur protein n=1 Tax=Magnetospirillum sp. UT-4 TaxID=2681467 RepID=UPI00137F815A|nr:LutB/LldF family L-lactate oxidation iron-sulfur protein [Magnetospirillum sp. UT-4]CAA7621918.1 Lactate utilization protein B [Magnetospirillum sp. UT-4]